MKNNIEINPIDMKHDICLLLQKLNYQYEVYTSNSRKEYDYLDGNDMCITIPNIYCEYPMYIDLEDNGEFTLSYYKRHIHYLGEKIDYNRLCEDLTDILKNNKCVIIINSNKRWLCSELSKTKVDKNYNYKYDIGMLPKEFRNELKEFGGNVELFYWNVKDNVSIEI